MAPPEPTPRVGWWAPAAVRRSRHVPDRAAVGVGGGRQGEAVVAALAGERGGVDRNRAGRWCAGERARRRCRRGGRSGGTAAHAPPRRRGPRRGRRRSPSPSLPPAPPGPALACGGSLKMKASIAVVWAWSCRLWSLDRRRVTGAG